ncbi:hypothetical protein EM10_25980, partial [Salmonella enterica subsp. enterica serovar Typhimurium]
GHNGLDGGERIAAALLGLNQRLTDAPIHPHLVVDRLAGSLELLLMLGLCGGSGRHSRRDQHDRR